MTSAVSDGEMWGSNSPWACACWSRSRPTSTQRRNGPLRSRFCASWSMVSRTCGPDHGVGLQPVGLEHHYIHDLLHFGDAGRNDDALVLLGEDALRQVFLGVEVEVQGALGDSCLVEDLGDRGRLVPVFLEDLGRCRKDRLTGTDGS